MKTLVLFASGSGSNAENIMLHFQNSDTARVAAVFCNNPEAGVIAKAQSQNVSVVVFTKSELADGTVLRKLGNFHPDLIVLAGFLLKFPTDIVAAYPNAIINIHPALLPKYGGKGMYGMHVHRSVLENNDAETGISIHYVNENYDEGNIIFQQSVAIGQCTAPEEIALKVQQLEHEHLPQVIERILNSELPKI